MLDRRSGNWRLRSTRFARSGLTACLLLLAAARFGGASAALDLINLAATALAVGSVMFAVFLLFQVRRWPARVLLCICILPGIALLIPRTTDRAECDASARRLRVAWINAHHPWRPHRIAAWLEKERPDVVGVAELGPDLPLRDMLRERYPYGQSCLGNGRCSTLLYSRIAPVGTEGLAHGDPENRRALSAVRMAFAPQRKGGASDAVPDMQVFAVHLPRPLPLGGQSAMLLELEQRLGQSAGTIVMGDLNMSPRMRLLHDFAARNGFTTTRTERPTWPIEIRGYSLPGFWQIDHLLVGRDWKVTAIRVGPDVGSDHKGFVADLCRNSR